MEEKDLPAVSPTAELEELKDKLAQEKDIDELKNIVSLFNLNIKKKEILRKGVISELQDKAVNQISQRIEKHPEEFSNKDLLDYTKTFNELLKTNNSITDEDIPSIVQLNPTQININLENKGLSKESRDRVADVVRSILERTNKVEDNSDVIDVKIDGTKEDETQNGE